MNMSLIFLCIFSLREYSSVLIDLQVRELDSLYFLSHISMKLNIAKAAETMLNTIFYKRWMPVSMLL